MDLFDIRKTDIVYADLESGNQASGLNRYLEADWVLLQDNTLLQYPNEILVEKGDLSHDRKIFVHCVIHYISTCFC